MKSVFEIKSLPENYDYLAPDGSEIRLLAKVQGGGLCHCTMPAGKRSAAVRHKTVEEIWYFVSGEGEMWLKEENNSKSFKVKAGDSINIPVGNSFQFKSDNKNDLCIIIVTIPNWPGSEEAVTVEGFW